MAYPKTDRGTQFRIVKSRNGAMVYGNKSGFRTLAHWMEDRVEIFNESGKGGLKRNRRFEITFMVLNRTEISRVRERTSGARAKKRAR